MKPRHPWTVYLLADPDTGEVRYVGKTGVSLADRTLGHIQKARRQPRTLRDAWLRGLLSRGLLPLVFPVHTAPSERVATNLEREAIRSRVRDGADLLNIQMTPSGVHGPSGTARRLEHAAAARSVALPDRLWFDRAPGAPGGPATCAKCVVERRAS